MPLNVDGRNSGTALADFSLHRNVTVTHPPATARRWHNVVKRAVHGHQALVSIDTGVTFNLHRFAIVGKGDRLCCECDGKMFAFAKSAKHPAVPIQPVWTKNISVSVLGREIHITIKEIETGTELDGYQQLTRHHYKSGAGPGRRAPLIAIASDPNLPKVVGFVEICSAFLVNVPRKALFDRPYCDQSRGVSWNRWDIDTAKKYINVTARISRCVVLPELRGLGLATRLADAAAEFATQRWHYGGHRPSFLEITAEMLRYWPFVRKSEFVHLGDTQGNEARLRKTMQYLLARKANGKGFPKGGGGIVTMHRSHATIVDELMRSRGWTMDHLLDLLTKTPEDLAADDWIALHPVYRRPKPVYMRGLTPEAEAHLQQFQLTRRVDESIAPSPNRAHLEIVLDKFVAKCDAERSKEVRQIQEAFGIVAKSMETTIASDLAIRLDGGQTLLVSGPSGSGKSLLLRALLWHASGQRDEWAMPAGTNSTGCLLSRPVRVETWRCPDPAQSPIGIMAAMGQSLKQAMRLLSSAGLAEANLFVRPSSTLSSGQYYRLGLALALANNPELLIIDEFCESLDDFAASAVCRRLAQKARKDQFILVVATSTAERITTSLAPTSRLYLRPNGGHEWATPLTSERRAAHA